jgi:hypothetical protein
MNALSLLAVAIITAVPAAGIDVRYPDATTVYECGFEQHSDEDFDLWPLGWTRRHGPGYPRYLPIRISAEPSPQGSRALRIDLDGNAATAYSPMIDINARHQYVLEGFVRTEKLVRDEAYLSVRLLNEKRELVETISSNRVRSTDGWTKLRIGPFAAAHNDVRYAVVALHLEPTGQPDLVGAALFDDIWLGQLPRVRLMVDDASRLYALGREMALQCEVSGLADQHAEVTVAITDPYGRAVEDHRARVRSVLTATPSPMQDEPAPSTGRVTQTAAIISTPGARQWRWKIAIAEPGFYRAAVTLSGRNGMTHTSELTWTVIAPGGTTHRSEFGWNLAGHKTVAITPVVQQLLRQAGISRVKVPVWSDSEDKEQLDALVSLADNLRHAGIGMVAVLEQPPASVLEKLKAGPSPAIARVFEADSAQWAASLDPPVLRLATQVESWQLGRDADKSFVDYPQLAEKIEQVKKAVDAIGQDLTLALPWNWQQASPDAKRPPWRILSLSDEPPMTAGELATYLDTMPSREKKERIWVNLRPLDRHAYSLETRLIDLVERMNAAKIHGAEAIWLSDLADNRSGMLNADATPSEMYLPWRTTALALAGSEYLGRLTLPEDIPNHVFARDGQVTLVVWSPKTRRASLHLGDDVRQVDVWGRSVPLERDGSRQVIEAGPVPRFIVGVNESITRSRLSMSLVRPQLASVFGVRQPSAIRLKSFFDRGMTGTAKIVAPEGWRVSPDRFDVQLTPGQELALPVSWTIPLNGTTGVEPFRIDFDLLDDPHIEFSVFGQIQVGGRDVRIEIASQLNDAGQLEVEQRMTNDSDSVISFRCYLYAPNERRQRAQVIRLGRGQDTQIYHLPDGASLLGQTLWLRAEEIGGPRVLSYRFIAENE